VSLVPAGAVKVTPGHSPPDLALARAHGLPLLCVIGDDGTVCPPGGGWLQVPAPVPASPNLSSA
ncbi:SYVM protein, partial [Pelecanoides urinatrix]|nr:SYVM protein [Pelecanoides urinatrix]